jgi:hypothetical protein
VLLAALGCGPDARTTVPTDLSKTPPPIEEVVVGGEARKAARQ